jgi:hypothetical protein
LYWVCKAVPDVLVVKKQDDELPDPRRPKQKHRNPIYSLARMGR